MSYRHSYDHDDDYGRHYRPYWCHRRYRHWDYDHCYGRRRRYYC
jgi:hypothetical protein